MANNKFSGYNPNYSKQKRIKGSTAVENRLDHINPYEFNKGMDYVLAEMGCDRLAESTPEERMKATETVISNLQKHPGYYTGLLTYETEYRNQSSKPNFIVWLKEFYEEPAMKPVPKAKLKEAIKKEIKKKLLKEQTDDLDLDFEDDEDIVAKQAAKVSKKRGKGMKGLDKEEETLRKEKISLQDKVRPLAQAFNARKKGKKPYSKSDYEADLKKIKTSDKSSVYSGSGNDHVTDRIKAINVRLEDIEKEREAIILKEKIDRRSVASTLMDREVHKELLNIIKEYGISLREGSSSIKPYYEIAKIAYMEGLTCGLGNPNSN
jgi:hypothetical protein